MKFLAVALADETQRFVKGYPPKGARLFLRPNLEIARLASLINEDEFCYLDERVEHLEPSGGFDLVLLHCDFGSQDRAHWLVEEYRGLLQPVLLFGPQVTAWADRPPPWASHRVKGDITAIFDEVRADARRHRLKPLYEAPMRPHYTPPRMDIARHPALFTRYQTVQFVRGCACPEPLRHLCPEYLYYGTSTLLRRKDEVLGEVLSLPGKHIHLLDEDVARFPEYYTELFRLLWNYRRHWTVNAGEQLFNHPQFIRLLAKAGTKIVYLNESFLAPRLAPALKSEALTKQIYRRVKFLQSRRLLVGAKLTLDTATENFNAIATLLRRIDLDFVEIRFTAAGADGKPRLTPALYHPQLTPRDPAWIKSRFYSFNALLDRFIRRPRRVGFYSTAWYLVPYSLAYRQNFLEGLPYP